MSRLAAPPISAPVVQGTGPRVDARHPKYDKFVELWMKCRDTVAGEEQVKAAGTKYLPMLDGQEGADYDSYRLRAMLYGASDRTVRGLAGEVMRKPPIIEFPGGDASREQLDKVGLDGEPLESVAKAVIEEVLTAGRVGLLVDSSQDDDSDPYIALYFSENIVNWHVDTVDGRLKLIQVVLMETFEKPSSGDPFALEEVTQFRVLRLGSAIQTEQKEETALPPGAEQDGVYHVEIWRKVEEVRGKERVERYVRDAVIVPTRRGGQTLDFLPFTFVNPSGVTAIIEKPPILDLVNVNLSHYRTSADLEHGRHFTALPTAWVAGFDTKSVDLRIGSSIAWISDNPQAQAGFLEFTGAGLGSLSEALKDKERLMAVLGARLLEEPPKGVEAAETVKLRHLGEQSVLSSIAESTSTGLSLALQWIALWSGRAGEASIKLNQDYDVAGIDPTYMTALMGALQNGSMSWETWWYNLKRGEVYPDDWTLEDERESIMRGLGPAAAGAAPEEDQDFGDDEEAETEEDE